jgi:putative membrane protein
VRLLRWLVSLLVLALLLVFALANREPVTVWPLGLRLPLAILVLICLLAGFAFGMVVAWIGGRHWRRAARHQARQVAALERELAATQARLGAEAAAAAGSRAAPARFPLTEAVAGGITGGDRRPLHQSCASSVPRKSSPPWNSPP